MFVPREHFDGCVLGTVVKEGRRFGTHEWRSPRAGGDPRQIVDDPGNLFRTGTASERGILVLEDHYPLALGECFVDRPSAASSHALYPRPLFRNARIRARRSPHGVAR